MQRSFLALALAGAALAASAQPIAENPDWKELEAPPPPPLHTTGLIPLDMPATTLRFGVDPASVSIGSDNIVRYVVVATSPSGALNAMYEGIRCDRGEFKTYARYNPQTGWSPVARAEWKPLLGASNSRYSYIVARSGACREDTPNGPVAQILQDLRAPVDRRFERGGVNR